MAILRMLLEMGQVLLDVAWYIIIVQGIFSWLIAFNVINTYNDAVRSLWHGLERLTDPIYRPIRRILPSFGALDLSPLVVLVIILLLQVMLRTAAHSI